MLVAAVLGTPFKLTDQVLVSIESELQFPGSLSSTYYTMDLQAVSCQLLLSSYYMC